MRRPRGFEQWCETLKRGQITGASVPSSQKSHLVRITGFKSSQNSRDGSSDKSKLTADCLCNTKGGNWYWSPSVHGDPRIPDEDTCRPCLSKWRVLGCPTIRIFSIETAQGQEEELPFGWVRNVESEQPRKTFWHYDKIHITFKEARCWARGDRVVAVGQVTEDTGEEKYPLLVATRWVEQDRFRTHYRCTTMEQALDKSYEMMAQGGY